MDHDTAIAECKLAFDRKELNWPTALIRFLDQTDDPKPVFAWIVRCVRRLSLHLGEYSPELRKQLALLKSFANRPVAVDVIQAKLEELWVQRSPHETARTAVVQSFGSLNHYRQGHIFRHSICAAPIVMLVDAAQDRNRAFREALDEFVDFVSEGQSNDASGQGCS